MSHTMKAVTFQIGTQSYGQMESWGILVSVWHLPEMLTERHREKQGNP